MAKLEIRKFGSKKFLLVVSENKTESEMIDFALGKTIPTAVRGEVTLSDGYAEHHIRLEKGVQKGEG